MAGTVYVAAVHLSGGTRHEHITSLIWANPKFKSGKSPTATLVDYIEKGNAVKVSDGKTVVDVQVVKGPQGKYLRTEHDGKPTDNLLALPHF